MNIQINNLHLHDRDTFMKCRSKGKLLGFARLGRNYI